MCACLTGCEKFRSHILFGWTTLMDFALPHELYVRNQYDTAFIGIVAFVVSLPLLLLLLLLQPMPMYSR